MIYLSFSYRNILLNCKFEGTKSPNAPFCVLCPDQQTWRASVQVQGVSRQRGEGRRWTQSRKTETSKRGKDADMHLIMWKPQRAKCNVLPSVPSQLRTALDKIEEMEMTNNHLVKRLEKMKANRNALLSQQWGKAASPRKPLNSHLRPLDCHIASGAHFPF